MYLREVSALSVDNVSLKFKEATLALYNMGHPFFEDGDIQLYTVISDDNVKPLITNKMHNIINWTAPFSLLTSDGDTIQGNLFLEKYHEDKMMQMFDRISFRIYELHKMAIR